MVALVKDPRGYSSPRRDSDLGPSERPRCTACALHFLDFEDAGPVIFTGADELQAGADHQ